MTATPALGGVRIVTMAQNVPGPLAAARLRAAGAHVTKVEPLDGDPLLTHSAAWHAELHRDIPIERLDLKGDSGHARLRALLADADVFMTSHRPSALARLRLAPSDLHQRLPGLRLLRIVGDTTKPDVPGHDLTYQAQVGLLDERMPRTLLADVLASERAYAGVFVLLRQPPGSVLDVGLVQSLDSAIAPLRHGLTAPEGVLGGAATRYRIYATREGHIAVAALEPHFERALHAKLGLSSGSDLAAHFRARSADEWEAWAREHDLPIAAIRGPRPLPAPIERDRGRAG